MTQSRGPLDTQGQGQDPIGLNERERMFPARWVYISGRAHPTAILKTNFGNFFG